MMSNFFPWNCLYEFLLFDCWPLYMFRCIYLIRFPARFGMKRQGNLPHGNTREWDYKNSLPVIYNVKLWIDMVRRHIEYREAACARPNNCVSYQMSAIALVFFSRRASGANHKWIALPPVSGRKRNSTRAHARRHGRASRDVSAVITKFRC